MGREKFNAEKKIAIIKAYKAGEVTYSRLREVYGMNPNEIYRWISKYEIHGEPLIERLNIRHNGRLCKTSNVLAAWLEDSGLPYRLHDYRTGRATESGEIKKFGYHLQKGKMATAEDEHIKLKRVLVQRGFRITNSATGVIEAGNKFDLTLEQVNKFWEQQLLRRMETK